MDHYERIVTAVGFIKKRCSVVPSVGVVLGSGLGDFADSVAESTAFDYADLPHFKKTGVAGHAGRLVIGRVGGVPAAVLQGRFHYYEGHEIADVVFPVRVLAMLGVHGLLLTNAAGGINRRLRPGDRMIIRDHINLMGVHSLRGVNDERLGPRFVDMSAVYDTEFQNILSASEEEIGRKAERGVYAAVSGPSFETPAEVAMLALLGADAVGMSTVPEALCARHMGLRVAGISCIANLAAGVSDQPLTHGEVIQAADRMKENFIRLLNLVVPRLA